MVGSSLFSFMVLENQPLSSLLENQRFPKFSNCLLMKTRFQRILPSSLLPNISSTLVIFFTSFGGLGLYLCPFCDFFFKISAAFFMSFDFFSCLVNSSSLWALFLNFLNSCSISLSRLRFPNFEQGLLFVWRHFLEPSSFCQS